MADEGYGDEELLEYASLPEQPESADEGDGEGQGQGAGWGDEPASSPAGTTHDSGSAGEADGTHAAQDGADREEDAATPPRATDAAAAPVASPQAPSLSQRAPRMLVARAPGSENRLRPLGRERLASTGTGAGGEQGGSSRSRPQPPRDPLPRDMPKPTRHAHYGAHAHRGAEASHGARQPYLRDARPPAAYLAGSPAPGPSYALHPEERYSDRYYTAEASGRERPVGRVDTAGADRDWDRRALLRDGHRPLSPPRTASPYAAANGSDHSHARVPYGPPPRRREEPPYAPLSARARDAPEWDHRRTPPPATGSPARPMVPQLRMDVAVIAQRREAERLAAAERPAHSPRHAEHPRDSRDREPAHAVPLPILAGRAATAPIPMDVDLRLAAARERGRPGLATPPRASGERPAERYRREDEGGRGERGGARTLPPLREAPREMPREDREMPREDRGAAGRDARHRAAGGGRGEGERDMWRERSRSPERKAERDGLRSRDYPASRAGGGGGADEAAVRGAGHTARVPAAEARREAGDGRGAPHSSNGHSTERARDRDMDRAHGEADW
jgi:hypothetical protein